MSAEDKTTHDANHAASWPVPFAQRTRITPSPYSKSALSLEKKTCSLQHMLNMIDVDVTVKYTAKTGTGDEPNLPFIKDRPSNMKQRSLAYVSHLENTMSAQQVENMMKARFSELKLPSLRDDEASTKLTVRLREARVPEVENAEEHTIDESGQKNLNQQDKDCMLWKSRTTTEHMSGNMLLPTEKTGILYNDNGSPIEGELNTECWIVNNSVMVGIGKCGRFLSRLILVSPQCNTLSPLKKLLNLRFLSIKNAKYLESKALVRAVPRVRSRNFGNGMLVEVDFTGCGNNIEDQGMSMLLKHHRSMSKVVVPHTGISDGTGESLGAYCQKLQVVNFAHTNITSRGIQLMMMGCPKVYDINVCACDSMTARGALVIITPDETRTFSNKLVSLNFARTQFRNTCCYWLCKGYPSLKFLDISDCQDTSDAGVIELSRGCRKIEHLAIKNLPNLTPIGVRSCFQNLAKLKYIDVSGNRRLNDRCFIVSSKERDLNGFDMSNMAAITDVGLNAMCTIRSLTNITVASDKQATSHVTDKMQRQLASHCPLLKSVNYSGVIWLSDLGILALVNNCQKLEMLSIVMADKSVKGGVGFLFHERGPSDQSFEGCLKHPALKTLKFENSSRLQLRSKTLFDFAQSNSCLEHVSFAGCINISSKSYVHLMARLLPEVKSCDVSRCSHITLNDTTKIISSRCYYGFSKTGTNGFVSLHPRFAVQDAYVRQKNRQRHACIHISRYFRGYVDRKQFVYIRSCAIIIQCMIRMHQAWTRRMEKFEEYKRKRALQFVQNLQSRNLRICYQSWLQELEVAKAKKLAKAKAFARMWLLKYVRVCMGHWHEYVHLQFRLRRLMKRVLHQKMYMYFNLFEAQVCYSINDRKYPFARKIQQLVRTFLAKRAVKRIKHRNAKRMILERWSWRESTLTMIQKWWRGCLCRLHFDIFLGNHNQIENYSQFTLPKQHLKIRRTVKILCDKRLKFVQETIRLARLERDAHLEQAAKYERLLYMLLTKTEVLRQLMRSSRNVFEVPLPVRLGNRLEWVAKIAYLVGHGDISFDGEILGFSLLDSEKWSPKINHMYETPDRSFALIDKALRVMGEKRTEKNLLNMVYQRSFKVMMDEKISLEIALKAHKKKISVLNTRIDEFSYWQKMLNISIRRYYAGSSMFFSPHLIEQWRLYDHSSEAHDLANAHAIKIQSAVRLKLARNRLNALKYTSRGIKTFEYMTRRIVLRQFVERSISTGMNLIFHRAIEKIVEERRLRQRKEKAEAKTIVHAIITESIARAHTSLLEFYEREDARYRLSVMESVAFRLQSCWRGRAERAKLFEANRRSKGSSKPVDCGWEHTVLIKPDGTVFSTGLGDAKCIYWKRNELTLSMTSIPKLNVMAFKVTSVACGANHTLFHLSNLSVLAAGSNSKGQLGLGRSERCTVKIGDSISSPESVPLQDNLLAAKIYAGAVHSMILTTEGSVFTFGYNGRGQLGIGSSLDDVDYPSKVVDLGPKNPSNSSRWLSALLVQAGRKPAKVRGEKRAAAGALGDQHSGILTDDGKIYMWGSAERGRLGFGETQGLSVVFRPKLVESLAKYDIIQLSCGRSHSVAVTDFMEVFVWGDGVLAPLGFAERKIQWVPRELKSLIGAEVVKVECGEAHSIALTSAGRVMTWGVGKYGRCGMDEGDEQDIIKPRVVDSLLGKRIIHIAAGRDFSFCVDSEGAYYSFGHGYYGTLGSGLNSDEHVAKEIDVQDWVQYSQKLC